ncbi:MAG: signal peptidase I [Trueperaceae bacterium]|nr:signal peptidase I [Trueperaceae bacterium]
MTTEGTAANRAAKPASLRRELRLLVEALVVAYLVVTFGFTTVGVIGSSMEPTLTGASASGNLVSRLFAGDRLFIPKYETWLRRTGLLGGYQRGEIVVLREPDNAPTAVLSGKRDLVIKRIVGLPGDRVRIEAGQVFVNGVAIAESFTVSTGALRLHTVDFPQVVVEGGEVTALVMGFNDARARASTPLLPSRGVHVSPLPVDDPRVQLYYGALLGSILVPDDAPQGVPMVLDLVVPPGRYFVLGDNRSFGGSQDSRYFGTVDAMSITGRATAVIWPFSRAGGGNVRGLSPAAAYRLQ